MEKVFITVAGEDNLNNTLKVLNTLSKEFMKVYNPTIGLWRIGEFYLTFTIDSKEDLEQIELILGLHDLTSSLDIEIETREC